VDFDEIYNFLVPSKESILNKVDEYTLYCYYTGLDDLRLNKAYNSPYRFDSNPSFSVFRTTASTVEYYWKDSATGEYGDVFKLIQKLENLNNIEEVFQRINEDFGLDFKIGTVDVKPKIQLYKRPQESVIKIRVSEIPLTDKGLRFWNQFNITKELLDLYKTTQIQYYWSYQEQLEPYTVLDPTFAYRIGNHYQVYSPYAERAYKWRNDLPDNYFFGYQQLPKTGDILIIDKSPKDMIFCKRLGYSAIAPKSESTMIPHKKVLELKDRFEKIYLCLDPDNCGETMTKKYMDLYPWMVPIFMPSGKDKTGLCLEVGFEQTKQIINNLIK
jgi:hypothetical protein